MSRGKFAIPIMPSQTESMSVMERLRGDIDDYAKKNGPEKCATFAQIFFKDGGAMELRGRLYTGEAMKYIHRALRQATIMQDVIDKEESK